MLAKSCPIMDGRLFVIEDIPRGLCVDFILQLRGCYSPRELHQDADFECFSSFLLLDRFFHSEGRTKKIRIMKKRSTLITPAILALSIWCALPGCISKKKYEEAVQELARMKVDSTYGAYDLSKVEYEKDAVIYELKDTLLTKARRLDSLELILNRQRARLNKTYKVMDRISRPGLEVTAVEGRVMLNINDNILFLSDSDAVTDPGKAVIKEVSEALQEVDEEFEVWVIGHTDSRPYYSENHSNWQLSTNRALSVVDLLIENDVEPRDLVAAGRSKFDPVATNRTIEGRKMNRRTEIVLVPTAVLN